MDKSKIPAKYHDYIDNKHANESDQEWMDRIDCLLDPGERGNDLYKPCFNNSDNEYLFDPQTFGEEAIDNIFDEAALHHTTHDQAVLPVYLQVAKHLNKLNIVRRIHSTRDNDAEFYWSRARCVFAGAGFDNWKPIAQELTNTWPLCPFDANETEQHWEEHNTDAHKICGWPTTLGWLNWQQLVWADHKNVSGIPKWLTVACVFELLKTVRFNKEKNALIFFRDATVQEVMLEHGTTRLADMRKVRAAFNSHVSYKLGNKTDGYYSTARAFERIMETLHASAFLPQTPRSKIHPKYLHGPWTHLVPDVQNYDGFIGHGLGITGAWVSENGTVKTWSGSADDVMSWDWPTMGENFQQHAQFVRILPATYSTTWAFDKFVSHFPNMEIAQTRDVDALAALFDAPVVASLLRHRWPELEMEYPYIVFQPETPSPGDDTNQGKSTIALAYARCMAPGLDGEIRLQASTSAPVNRSFGEYLIKHGTACLGEFVVPSTAGHVMSQSNMQAIATGGGISHGRVYSNDTSEIKLTHSLVLNSKNCGFREDMCNRSLFFWLGQLDDTARKNHSAYIDATSGRLSLDCRLGLIATIESMGEDVFVQEVERRINMTQHGLRFSIHKAIAQFIYELRGGSNPMSIDHEIMRQAERQEQHDEDATVNGVTQEQRADIRAKVKFRYLFERLDDTDIRLVANRFNNAPVTPKQFIEAYMEQQGIASNELPEFVEELTGIKSKVNVMAISRQLSKEIRRMAPETDNEIPLPGLHSYYGWSLRRAPDRSRQVFITLTQEEENNNAGQETGDPVSGQRIEDSGGAEQ